MKSNKGEMVVIEVNLKNIKLPKSEEIDRYVRLMNVKRS